MLKGRPVVVFRTHSCERATEQNLKLYYINAMIGNSRGVRANRFWTMRGEAMRREPREEGAEGDPTAPRTLTKMTRRPTPDSSRPSIGRKIRIVSG